MPATYDCIATTTLSSSQSSVTFSSISGTYTDLVLICSYTISLSGPDDYPIMLRLNGDTGTNYSETVLRGNGSTASSGRTANRADGIYTGGFVNVNNTAINVISHFQNYSNTTTNKTVLSRTNISTNETNVSVGLWRNTSAINSIRISNFYSSNFSSGSTFTLYGIQAA